ncbi:ABC transporter permease [Paucibacter sp. KBW04]|uniref:FecCD family ABC transporter permease n=1 Tax=Paucibacter sp. KBW04 TaxID=2153361 RepID=UPI000F55BC80|nr:iron chelate uptake ABC transporter family permease subunit [Paucibacter sp. KBW04]RQO62439.1 ABC transporter permease [Paucibacter sp. KBW04]
MSQARGLGLGLVLMGLMLMAMLYGPGRVGMAQSWLGLWRPEGLDEHGRMVLLQLRLPRLLAALAVGAALGLAGCLMQRLSRNPLAEPGLLGVNSGATLAIALGLSLQGTLGPLGLLLWALCGALLATLAVLWLARRGQGRRAHLSPLRLLLAGLALAATARGLMAFLLLMDQQGLDQFRFWVLASLARVGPDAFWLSLSPLLLGLGLVLACGPRLSLLLLDDDLAAGLGARPTLLRAAAVIAVALLAGGAVAWIGPLAFLGFAAPYLARSLGWQAPLAQLWASAGLGAICLLAADLLGRWLCAPFEPPLSALCALLGAPLLVLALHRDASLGLRK